MSPDEDALLPFDPGCIVGERDERLLGLEPWTRDFDPADAAELGQLARLWEDAVRHGGQPCLVRGDDGRFTIWRREGVGAGFWDD